MSYELFEKAAAANSEFEVIPTKVSLYAQGIVLDKNGWIQYEKETYVTNMVKLTDLPIKIQPLFMEKKNQLQESTQEVVEPKAKEQNNLDNLNSILFEQLQNIVDPEDGADMSQELKKANAVCNVADKILTITDLTLKAEMLQHKKRTALGRSLYQD